MDLNIFGGEGEGFARREDVFFVFVFVFVVKHLGETLDDKICLLTLCF